MAQHSTAIQVDPVRFLDAFDRRPFRVRHALAGEPLLALPALLELARRLPEAAVEYNSGDLPVGHHEVQTPRTGLSVAQTLERIEHAGSWMVLKYVEADPAYAALLGRCLAPLRPLIEQVRPGIQRCHAFVFVSSPQAVTPYHADFEHNFLLQVRGSKVITVWDGEDRRFMAETERESRVAGAPRNLPWDDAFAAAGLPFELAPGDGVQVPLSSPHWVRVGPEASISFSITFLSRHGARVRALHTVNRWLRRRGWTPRPVGRAPLADACKFAAYRLVDAARRGGPARAPDAP